MACWRPLEVSQQPSGNQVPPLLVKADFKNDSYSIHLTCLSNVWSEELDLDDIVNRASQEQSPIEVSKQDTTQLAILLENIEKSLAKSSEAFCRISRAAKDGVTIHTSIALPAPLGSLTWKFDLKKRNSTILKNELILPLLLSSHIQYERIGRLLATINDKDKAITRLVDQFESSNLDLAAAFPVISGLKSGRKPVKREQAAKHVLALQPFRENEFKDATSSLEDREITTLGLFQEALSECAPRVPGQLQSTGDNLTWWDELPDHLGPIKIAKPRPAVKNDEPVRNNAMSDDVTSGDETEDEFEVHENFKTRATAAQADVPMEAVPATIKDESDGTDDTEEDDDLDAPASQKSFKRVLPTTTGVEANLPPPARPRNAGFRIGGRSNRVTETPPAAERRRSDDKHDDLPVRHVPSSPAAAAVEASPKKFKKGFKIGGKGKAPSDHSSQAMPDELEANNVDDEDPSHAAGRASSSPIGTSEESSVEQSAREETAEEKAERRRAELKRKTAEAAKKQAQQTKKRRF